MTKTISPNRRRSIAVLNMASPARRKRRASSFGLDKHRILAPRKSILKAPLPIPGDEDITGRLSAVSTNSRKSAKPRVSFASHAHVRLFEKKEVRSGSSSPAASPPVQQPGSSYQQNDENAYPGANPGRRRSTGHRRRSSLNGLAASEGDDMDLDDSANYGAIASDDTHYTLRGLASDDTDNLADMAPADTDQFDDDMDLSMTKLGPRRSSFPALPTNRLSEAFSVYQDGEDDVSLPGDLAMAGSDLSNAEEQDASFDHSGADSIDASVSFTQHEEFNHPIEEALNPPKPPSQELLDLIAATHSGQIGVDDDNDGIILPNHSVGAPPDEDATDMSVDDAISRLSQARRRKSETQDMEIDPDIGNDSFESNHSFGDRGDETINVTKAFRNRASSIGFGLLVGAEDTDELFNLSTGSVSAGHSAAPISPGVETLRQSLSAVAFTEPLPVAPMAELSISEMDPPSSSPPRPVLSDRKSVASLSVAQESKADSAELHQGAAESSRSRRDSDIPSGVTLTPSQHVHSASPDEAAPSQERQSLELADLRPPSGTRKSITPRASFATSSSGSRPSLNHGQTSNSLFASGSQTAASAFKPRESGSVFSRPRQSLMPAPRQSISRPARPSVGGSGPRISLLASLGMGSRPSVTLDAHPSLAASDDSSPTPPSAELSAEVEAEDREADDEAAALSMDDFLELLNIRFMDHITVPRRSLATSRMRRSSVGAPLAPSTNADYFLATALYVPQLEVYSEGIKDIQDKIETLRLECAQNNEDVKKLPPEVFAAYLEGTDEEKSGITGTIQKLKTDSRELAKKVWYDKRLDWIQQLQGCVDAGLADLAHDNEIMDQVKADLDHHNREREDELARVLRELEQEQAEVAEIESGNKDYVLQLKETIKEQDAVIADMRVEHAEVQASVRSLKQRELELNAQLAENEQLIAEAERTLSIKQGNGLDEMKKAKAQLELVQWLHRWRVVKADASSLELLYDERIHVSVPFRSGRIDFDHFDLNFESNDPKRDLWIPGLELALLKGAKHHILSQRTSITKNSQITQALSNYWISSRRLRDELEAVVKAWPTKISISSSGPSMLPTLKLVVPLLFRSLQARADITIIVDINTFANWPKSVTDTRIDVVAAYKRLDVNRIQEHICKTIAEMAPIWNSGCFVYAMRSAASGYPHLSGSL